MGNLTIWCFGSKMELLSREWAAALQKYEVHEIYPYQIIDYYSMVCDLLGLVPI